MTSTVQIRLIGFGPVTGDISLSPAGDPVEAAARLFGCLHAADASGAGAIAVARGAIVGPPLEIEETPFDGVA